MAQRDPILYAVYEKGDFRREVDWVSHLEVDYSLYKRQVLHDLRGNESVEWWRYHVYTTTLENWAKWVKGATLLKSK